MLDILGEETNVLPVSKQSSMKLSFVVVLEAYRGDAFDHGQAALVWCTVLQAFI